MGATYRTEGVFGRGRAVAVLIGALFAMAWSACWGPPNLPSGATPCNGPNDCDYPDQTCGFAGVNEVATCIPNAGEYGHRRPRSDAGR